MAEHGGAIDNTEKMLVRERFNADLRRQVERVIGAFVGEPTVEALSVTGEPYITMTNGGIKLVGDQFPVYEKSRSRALYDYLRNCWKYGAMRTQEDPLRTFLYWRRYPTILEFDDRTWVVHSRLLVSDKPPLTEAEREAA